MKFTGERFIPDSVFLNDEISYEHYHRYYSVAPLLIGKRILDVASGEGYGASIIEKYANSVIGLDFDHDTVSFANKKYSNDKVKFFQGNCTSMPFENHSFDVVVSFETIEHLNEEDQNNFMKEIKRVLTPTGLLIMSTPNKINYSDRFQHHNEFHFHEFEKGEFDDFYKKFL